VEEGPEKEVIKMSEEVTEFTEDMLELTEELAEVDEFVGSPARAEKYTEREKKR
jgi:hypothetical protein